MTELTLRRPDNLHVHFRKGPLLRTVLRHTADVYARALVMPNTDPPILDGAAAAAYRAEILRCLSEGRSAGFQPRMTIKLTDATTPAMIAEAKAAGVVAAKLYPAGTTTNSHGGVSDFAAPGLLATLGAMRDCGMALSVHAEMPGVPVLDAERRFISVIEGFRRDVPGLKVVVEHLSTADMASFVRCAGPGLAATITPMHLRMTLDDVLAFSIGDGTRRGLAPHNFCYPVCKTAWDREFLVDCATSGNPKFFAGDDSAPHWRYAKESDCGCAGVFCAPASLPTYAEVFEAAGRLGRLEDFMSRFGAEFYGLPPNEGTVTLMRRDPAGAEPLARDVVLANSLKVRVWRGGERLPWAVAE